MYRPTRGSLPSRFLSPYVVFAAVVAGVVVLAVMAALLIHFLAFDKKSYFYHSSFQILNVNYSDQLNSPATQQYRTLSGRIESVITTTFKESNLRNHFIRAHVVKLRQSGNGVIADTVMKFKFPRNNNGASMKSRIESVSRQMLNKFGNLEINLPTEITTITDQDAVYLFTQAFPKEIRRVNTILIHNNYNSGTHENDIAVVKLSRPIAFNKNIHIVCLPEATQNISPGSTAYVTGWGSQISGGNTVRDLQQGRVYIISNNMCNAPISYGGAVLPGMLCAGLPQGGVDACRGDSGGPLVQQDSRRIWFLVGIVSWGYECGLADKPGVYTRVTAYRNWITQQTGI
ncbi:transmembrane protease serine 11D isoform X3 [Desmodus rotundus]|uniref:transmembrane protease serine 11D isoform X3 n=1 Tax=Desmodus rotundus TaxID=9430 RepID=UPI001E1C15DB|nr:transmembrane protease serine 11D isoform X3 [Desmodus rotundus]